MAKKTKRTSKAKPTPKPRAAAVDGAFLNLKVPKATKAALKARAKADQGTLNSVARAALEKYLGL